LTTIDVATMGVAHIVWPLAVVVVRDRFEAVGCHQLEIAVLAA
jgi:hypothetical protein